MYDNEDDDEDFPGQLPGYRVAPGSRQVQPAVSRPGTLARNAVVLELRQSADEGPDYWYGQLFQWTAPGDQGAVPCALELKIQQQGIPFSLTARGGSAPNGWWTITYGAGTTNQTIQVDPSEATIQLPPCDYVSVELTVFKQSIFPDDPITAYASLARGYHPEAKPATYSYFVLTDNSTGPGYAFPLLDQPVPLHARAVSVLLGLAPLEDAPPPPDPTLPATVARLELENLGVTSAVQIVSVSTDGSADYPGYSPVAISPQRLATYPDPLFTLAMFGTVQQTALVIFYLAL